MNDIDEKKIVETLESYYHIQFEMAITCEGPKTIYKIYPLGDDLFHIVFRFSPIRLSIDVETDSGGIFVHTMGSQPHWKRDLFVQHYSILNEMGLTTTFKINGISVSVNDPDSWPNDWIRIYLHTTRILEDTDIDILSMLSEISIVVFGMVLSLANIIPNDTEWKYMEGSEKYEWVKKYERNPVNRKICIKSRGTKCLICGFDFELTYGEIGHNFIHIHHIVPISRMDGPRELNPLVDLIPVCPNCHYMLHRRDPPFEPEELKEMMATKSDIIQKR